MNENIEEEQERIHELVILAMVLVLKTTVFNLFIYFLTQNAFLLFILFEISRLTDPIILDYSQIRVRV